MKPTAGNRVPDVGMSKLYGLPDLKRCLLICAFVGTILVLINQGLQFFLDPPGNLAALPRVILNYLVPFSVASASAVMTNGARGEKSTRGL